MAKKILKSIEHSDKQKVLNKDTNLHTSILLAFFIVIGISFFLRTVKDSLLINTTLQNATSSTINQIQISPEDVVLKNYLVKGWNYLFGVEEAFAKVNLPDYGAEKYSKIEEITLLPNEVKKIKVGFYNRGTYNWRNNGKNHISLYTQDPKYHKSSLADTSWISANKPTKLKDNLVGPNSLGYFEFSIKAPKKTGTYKETFAIAAENKAWVTNGKFTLIITVTSKISAADTTTNTETTTEIIEESTLATENFFATRLSRIEPLILNPNEETTAAIMFLNKGASRWQNRKLILNKISPTTIANSTFFNPGNWLNENTILENTTDEILPGRTEIYFISLKAPQTPGIYTLHFALKSNEQNIEGGTFDLPITVKGNGINTEITEQNIIPTEPKIRIGLFTTEEPTEISLAGSYTLEDNAGQIFSSLSETNKISLAYSDVAKKYLANFNGEKIVSSNPLRLVAHNPEDYFTITNYKRNPLWTSTVNYNQFRGTIELRVAKTGYLWAINELPIEDYIKGLAEGIDGASMEYLKAQQTASRSYAYHELLNPTRHLAGYFTLDAEYDQVYRGYVREKASPNSVIATDETKGIIITYNGETVNTPYFTQSNGKTKSAKQVWGKEQPWLIPVVAKYDQGKKLWGHGVGMSTNDAMKMASKEDATWDTILKHYYTGVDLQKMY